MLCPLLLAPSFLLPAIGKTFRPYEPDQVYLLPPSQGKTNASLFQLQQWALERAEVKVHNQAVVALANKVAWLLWAVWYDERRYEPQYRRARTGIAA